MTHSVRMLEMRARFAGEVDASAAAEDCMIGTCIDAGH